MAGELTRAQMVNEVLDNVAKSSTAPTKSGLTLTTMVIRYLNRAQLKIARNQDLLFAVATATTVASQQSYALPTNLRSLYTLRLENGLQSVKLNVAMPWEFDALVAKPNETTVRQPQWYIPYKSTNVFELFPIPDAGYVMRLRYSYWPTTLTTDAQTSDFKYMDDVLIQYATGHLFYFLQEYDDSKRWFELANDSFKGAIEVEKNFLPDWAPKGKGFTTNAPRSVGEYYNDPLVINDAGIRGVL